MGALGAESAKPSVRLDLFLSGLGILGLVLFLALYDRAFPSAALDLELSRAQIVDRATEYLRGRGVDLAGHQFALTFNEAWLSSVYLQQTLGIPQTNALAREKALPLWLWEARWFKPLQKQEYYLSLMPDGEVVSLTHLVLEDAPGASIEQQAAQALAEAYLREDRGWELDDWERVSSSTVARPGGRSDHHFEWKRTDWDVGKSELRLAVDIQGDTVGGYGYWLKVPEAFVRRFSEQRNRAGFANNLSFYLGAGGFGAVAFAFFFLGHRRGVFAWREGLAAGLCVAGVELLSDLNTLLLRKAWYSTTQTYVVFWMNQLISILISALSVAGVVVVLAAGGRYLARRVWARQDKVLTRQDKILTRQDLVLTRSGDWWMALSLSTWRGLMLGAIGGGYVVLFYLVATRALGGWTPMGAPPVNLYATPLPFLVALAAGVVPATTEEFLFRLVGIGAVWALARRRWLAVVVPGVLWGFAHLSYVRDPIYLRGVELTLLALLYGAVFLRFDLTTTIVAHLAFNATLVALPLLRSGQPYFVANGALIVVALVAPVVPGIVQYVRRRQEKGDVEGLPSIRAAIARDVEDLAVLDMGEWDWDAWIRDPSATVLRLCLEDRAIGVAAGRVDPEQVGWVCRLYVEPSWRRRYWASRLAQALARALKDRGARALRVEVPSGEWILARFWDAQGWSPAATTYAPAVVGPSRPWRAAVRTWVTDGLERMKRSRARL